MVRRSASSVAFLITPLNEKGGSALAELGAKDLWGQQ